MPYSVTVLLTRSFLSSPHPAFCAVSGALFETCVLCTVGFILLASVDRFMGVYHHVYHRRYFQRENLTRMIVAVWVVSLLLILSYITLWITHLPRHPYHTTFTNLRVFTVCMGRYWLRTEHHVLGNIPSYLTVAILTLLMVVIVAGNLAVLKQLFKTRKTPLASLQSDNQARQRRNNTSMAPPMLIKTDSTQTIDVAKEQLKRISRAESNMEKSERIFQTDSSGDVTGININAIMALYNKATRGSLKKRRNRSGVVAAGRSPGVVGRRRGVVPGVSPLPQRTSEGGVVPGSMSQGRYTPSQDRYTPSLMDSVLEEEEEDEEDEEEEEEEEFVYSEEEDIDEELADLTADSPALGLEDSDLLDSGTPEEEDELNGLGDLDDDYETVWKVIKFVAALKRNSKKRQIQNWDLPDLVRSSSESDLSILQESYHSNHDSNHSNQVTKDYRVVTPGTQRRAARKFSEMARVEHGKCLSLPYQPLTFGRQVKSPTMEEINELVNGGELSPLMKRARHPDMASVISRLQTKGRVARDVIRKTSMQLFEPRTQHAPDRETRASRVSTETRDLEEGVAERSRKASTSSTSSTSSSWGTLTVIAKMRSKLLAARRQTTAEGVEGSDPLQRALPAQGGGNLITITEEELRSSTAPDLLAIPPSTSPAPATPAPITTTSPRRPRMSRTRSFDSAEINHAPSPMAMGSKRRRGGVPLQDTPGFTGGPASRGALGYASHTGGYASSLRQRVRQSTVYNRMSLRNSLNIASVTKMVYNFNKHARRKKKEIRAAKTILILVFYYIITLLLFVVSFYHITMLDEADRVSLPYWLTLYSYIIYLNAVFNPVIHFWRNARVRQTVLKIVCPKRVNDKIQRWKLRGGF